MNCTTESKNCQKREMRRWKAKITRKPSPVLQEALDILPEPKEDWEAYLWLVGSIGDAHFMMGNYGKSLEFFRKCYNIGETDNPFILLRLGENYLEMEDETNATEFLLRAYMLEGEKIFKEDWKYFQWLSGHVNLKQK
ncbi:tetratricopeptide repeat protein [Bacteroides thetaiotaomicron]|nr:tetratricopeptide repeat protein [Bacteroides thetaiotaomicron]